MINFILAAGTLTIVLGVARLERQRLEIKALRRELHNVQNNKTE